MKRLLFTALMAGIVLSASSFTVHLMGDSTMADKDIKGGTNPERGWGMMLPGFVDGEITVVNYAQNGRSTKSFIDLGLWDKLRWSLAPGDYVIIQFGHNDEKPKADRHTDPGSTFDYNLARFIRETREHGGIPILMNCVVRRNFFIPAPLSEESSLGAGALDDELLRTTTFKDGVKMIEGDTLVDTHGLYAVAPRDVAQRMNCHFIDANRITHDLEQGLGREASKKLHMWFLPGEEPSVPQGRQDNTHYNVYGAHRVASLLADALCQEIPLLSKYRR